MVDLTSCDQEPIHVPGSIQPQGVLLVVEPPDLRVVQVSSNTSAFLGLEPSEILQRSLDGVLDQSGISAVQWFLKRDVASQHDAYTFSAHLHGGEGRRDVTIYQRF